MVDSFCRSDAQGADATPLWNTFYQPRQQNCFYRNDTFCDNNRTILIRDFGAASDIVVPWQGERLHIRLADGNNQSRQTLPQTRQLIIESEMI
jgi:hypothetical protein